MEVTKMKRILTLIVAVLLLVTATAGCGTTTSNNQSDAGASSAASSATASAPANTNIFGWAVPEKTMEITYYAGQDNPDTNAENCEAKAAYLLKNFNVKLTKIVYDDDMEQRLNLMLSSGGYPDCIVGMSWQEAQKWVDQGRALELTSYIDEYGSNIKSRMGDYLKRYYTDDGKLYTLASFWGLTTFVSYAPEVRNDWYTEAGSPDVSTPEAYYAALKKMAAAHPENPSGDKTYALGMWKISSSSLGGNSFINTFGGMYGLKSGWKVNSDNSVNLWINSPEGVKMLEYLNQIYRDGMLDPDSFTMSIDEWGAKAGNERYAGFVGSHWPANSYSLTAWKNKYGANYNENMRYVYVDVKASGVAQSAFSPSNSMGSAVILTNNCKSPENYMKWFDFENTDLGSKLAGWGIPNEKGSVWTLDENGKWAYAEGVEDQLVNNIGDFDYDAETKAGGECGMLMTAGVEPMAGGGNVWINLGLEDKWAQAKDKLLKDSLFDFTSFLSVTIPTEDPLSDKSTEINDIVNNAWAKAITAKSTEACDAVIAEAVSSANSAGLADVEKYYSTQYQKNVSKYGK